MSQSQDLGRSWECFSGLDETSCFGGGTPQKALLSTDASWQNCVGPSRTIPGPTQTFGRSTNSSRVAVAVANAAASNLSQGDFIDMHWFFALGKTVGTQQRIHVYRAGGLDAMLSDTGTKFVLATTSPVEANLVDSWAPEATVMQRLGADQSRGVFVWRNGFTGAGNNLAIRGVDWRDGIATTTMVFNPVSNISAASGPFENNLGSRIGLATFQGCANDSIAGCPTNLIVSWPNVPFFVAWPDGRSAGTNYSVVARGEKL